jgi:hypothetical protein
MNVSLNDTEGNTNYTAGKFWINITPTDTTAPDLNITYPENITYNEIITQINYTFSDIVAMNTCWYSTDLGVTNTTLTCGQNATGLTSSTGSNQWFVWANDTSNNVNVSNVTFFVDTNVPQFSLFNEDPAEPVTYESGRNYSLNVTVANSNGTVELNINGINISANNPSGEVYQANITDYPVGNYSYYWSSYGNGTSVLFNSSSTVDYSYNITPANITMDTYINEQNVNLSYPFTTQTNATIIVDVGTAYIFRDEVDVTTENATNFSLGAGNYTYKFNATGNENYSSTGDITYQLNITQLASVVYVYLNNSNQNLSISQHKNEIIGANLSVGEGDVQLHYNGGLINWGNANLTNLTDFNTTGSFNVTAIYNQTQNYTKSDETYWVNVTAPADVTPPYFTNLANQTFNVSTAVSYDIDATDDVGIDAWIVNDTTNFTIDSNGVLTNLTALLVGHYFVNVTVNDTSANTNSTHEKFFINITALPPDTTPPTWTNMRNFSQVANTSFSESMTASDASGIGYYDLNDTSVFNISQDGTIINITALSVVATYWMNITVNDTIGNELNGLFFINITLASASKCDDTFDTIKIPTSNNKPYVQLCNILDFR